MTYVQFGIITWKAIIVGIFVFALLLFISLSFSLLYSYIKKYSYIIYKHIRTLCDMYYIVYYIFMHITKHNTITAHDIIFMLFCRFYEKNKMDFAMWELDKKYFPNGIKDISDMYYWIKYIRPENYNKLNNITQIGQHVLYYNSVYNSIHFYLKNNTLTIAPLAHATDTLQIEKALLKMHTMLHALDIKNAYWILERGKFFGF